MAVKIRLARMGMKKKPFYRVVVANAESPRDGRIIEQVGYYDPTKNPAVVKLDLERLDRWLDRGAQPTRIVAQLAKRVRDTWQAPRAEG